MTSAVRVVLAGALFALGGVLLLPARGADAAIVRADRVPPTTQRLGPLQRETDDATEGRIAVAVGLLVVGGALTAIVVLRNRPSGSPDVVR